MALTDGFFPPGPLGNGFDGDVVLDKALVGHGIFPA